MSKFKNNTDNNFPKIGIIIPTVYGGQKPTNCLKSIKKLNYPAQNIKAVLIDNNSPDQFFKKAKKILPDIITIKNNTNIGFPKAVNQGINALNSDYYFITNDDIYFDKNSLKILVEYAQKHTDVGIVGGKQLKYGTKKFLIGGRNFNFFTGLQKNLNAKKPVFCDQVDGCVMLIKKSVISKIGLFDEGYSPIYSEDLDFCIRAKRVGFKIAYHPKSVLYHHHAYTTSKSPLFHIYFLGFRNRLRLYLKLSNLTQFTSFVLIHYVIIMPFRILIKKEPIFLPELSAIKWNIKNFKQTLKARHEN